MRGTGENNGILRSLTGGGLLRTTSISMKFNTGNILKKGQK
jgi:hypothetical protein